MRRTWQIVLLISLLCGTAYAQSSTELTNLSTVKVRGRTSVPSLSTSGNAVFYFDTTSGKLKVSQNGGAFANFVSSGGTVTSVSVVTANGISGSVATSTTTPAITLTLGAITPTSVSTPSIITASGALGITPAAGSNLNVNLSTTGDFAVNTNQLYVDTSTGNVGIGSASPGAILDIKSTTNPYTELRLSHASAVQPYVIRHVPAADGLSDDVLQIGTGFLYGGGQSQVGAPGIIQQFENNFDNAGSPQGEWWVGVIEPDGTTVRTLMLEYNYATHSVNWSTVGSASNAANFSITGNDATLNVNDLQSRNANLRFLGIGQPTWVIRDVYGQTTNAAEDGIGFYNETANRWLAIALAGGGLSVTDGGVGTFTTAHLKAVSDGKVKLTNAAGADNTGILLLNQIGIGTVAPAGLLHVSSDTAATGLSFFTQANGSADGFDLDFRKARGTGVVPTVITTADELGFINFKGYGGAAGYIAGAAIKGISSGTIADSRVPGQLSFWTGTNAAPSVLTERMTIDNAGSVGIGETTPAAKLHIKTATGSPVSILLAQTGAANWTIGNPASSLLFQISKAADLSAPKLTIDNSGNVGIGIVGPAASLHVVTTDAATNTTVNTVIAGHQSTGTPAAGFGSGLLFSLESSTTVDQDAARIAALWTTSTHATRTADLVFSTVNNAGALVEGMRLTGAGGIRNPTIVADTGLTDTTVCQDTTNHEFVSGSGTLGICLGTSTLRAKQNVAPLGLGLNALMELKPISFTYRPGWGFDPKKTYYGFTAEDVRSVLPQLTSLDKTGLPGSVDLLGMVPLLIKAVQEMQFEIEALRKLKETK